MYLKDPATTAIRTRGVPSRGVTVGGVTQAVGPVTVLPRGRSSVPSVPRTRVQRTSAVVRSVTPVSAEEKAR